MKTQNNSWLYVMLGIVILLLCVNMWLNRRTNEQAEGCNLHRDSVIQLKIDSISQSVNDFKEIYINDRLIEDYENKITINRKTLNRKKDELFKNPIDSIYNWTKRKLSERTK
jgi:hypothetical protein